MDNTCYRCEHCKYGEKVSQTGIIKYNCKYGNGVDILVGFEPETIKDSVGDDPDFELPNIPTRNNKENS